MKLVQTTVGMYGYGEESRNEERVENAKKAIDTAKALGADILSLPAGYLTVKNDEDMNKLSKILLEYAKSKDITFMFGIDKQYKDISRDWGPKVSNETLPWFCYVWSRNEGKAYTWRQRSVTSRDQRFAPKSACEQFRAIDFNDSKVPILMCGEIFNARIRNNLIGHRREIKIVIDLAHIGQGFRISQPMKILSSNGIPSVASLHVQKHNAVKYYYSSDGRKSSDTEVNSIISSNPRIEMRLREIKSSSS